MTNPGSDDDQIALSQMKVPKASQMLADELRERILDGEYAEGAVLPPERQLVVQTGLSRTTVREALRILEVQGLVRIRPGRTGGAFVQRPGEAAMARTVDHIIRGRRIRLSALLDTREALEPYCAGLAAQNRSEDDVIALEATHERANADGTAEAHIAWHVEVARATHNKLISGVMMALERAVYQAVSEKDEFDDETRQQVSRSHEEINAAIRAQDSDAATSLMTQHVNTYARDLLTARREARPAEHLPSP